MFKKLIAFVAAMIFLSSMAAAQPQENPEKFLKLISGEWYDNDGALVLSIHDGCINGCKVLYYQRLAGGTTMAGCDFCISESTGERMIHLSWNIQHEQSDLLRVDNQQTLHKNFPFHFESICGIHLGMTKDEVNKKLGNNFKVINKKEMSALTGDGLAFDNVYYVAQSGLLIKFDAGSVDEIILLNSSKNVLAHSRLNCSNSLKEFAGAYQISLPRYPKHFGIGYGEFLSFGDGMRYLMLSNYSN